MGSAAVPPSLFRELPPGRPDAAAFQLDENGGGDGAATARRGVDEMPLHALRESGSLRHRVQLVPCSVHRLWHVETPHRPTPTLGACSILFVMWKRIRGEGLLVEPCHSLGGSAPEELEDRSDGIASYEPRQSQDDGKVTGRRHAHFCGPPPTRLRVSDEDLTGIAAKAGQESGGLLCGGARLSDLAHNGVDHDQALGREGQGKAKSLQDELD